MPIEHLPMTSHRSRQRCEQAGEAEARQREQMPGQAPCSLCDVIRILVHPAAPISEDAG